MEAIKFSTEINPGFSTGKDKRRRRGERRRFTTTKTMTIYNNLRGPKNLYVHQGSVFSGVRIVHNLNTWLSNHYQPNHKK